MSNKDLRFLVVDDMPQMCRIILSSLTGLGWKNISVATSGKDALNILTKKPIDIILLDNNMPGMDGLDFLDEIFLMNLDPKPKIIMVTADASAATVAAAINGGASDFITKPFQPNTLQEKVLRLFPTK